MCAGSAVPVIPGDNSHYVEGVSRYVWFPDGDGKAQLVDLQEPVDYTILNNPKRNGANNQYWLYTRNNPNFPQVLVNGNAASIQSSNYNSQRQLKVIVHGWNSNGNSDVNNMCVPAFLEFGDFNVIVVDWRELANANYVTASAGVPNVGQHIGNFLQWLLNIAGGNWNNVHLVGFSLGAHVIGHAGRQSLGQVARLTGLEPSGPMWGNSNNALHATHGVFVEAIHTDGGVLGIFDPLGNADFYPNGGRHPMPGCLVNTCSHSRSYEYFASSVRTNHFQGRQCVNLSQAEANNCTGAILNMGNGHINKRGSGLFALTTGRRWPF